MIPPGTYSVTVYHNGQQAETFSMVVQSSGLTRVDGPNWYGFGAMLDGQYVGHVLLRNSIGTGYHVFRFDHETATHYILQGGAVCISPIGQTNQTSDLTWAIQKA